MLGQLDGKSADAAGAGLDEDLLPLLQVGLLDQCLPCRQAHQRDGSGFFHREVLGLERKRCFLDRDELGERADAEVIRPRIDLVAHLELPHARADFDHHPGHVVAQDEGQAIGQDELELAVPDLGVQQVHAGGMDLDQDLVIAQFRGRHVCRAQRALLAIAIENECFHDAFTAGIASSRRSLRIPASTKPAGANRAKQSQAAREPAGGVSEFRARRAWPLSARRRPRRPARSAVAITSFTRLVHGAREPRDTHRAWRRVPGSSRRTASSCRRAR